MKRKAASIFQYDRKWYGVRFELQGKTLENVEVYEEKEVGELKELFGEQPYAVSLSPSAGYLMRLSFPFSGRRKIGLVLKSELEETLPFPLDSVSIDFREMGGGSVLVAAVPDTATAGLKDPKTECITMNSLAALHLLRWLNAINQDTFLYVYLEEATAVIMLFRDGSLNAVRQFYYKPGAEVISQVLDEMGQNGKLADMPCFLLAPREEVAAERAAIAQQLRIRVETPVLGAYLKDLPIPDHFWSGIGSALLSLNMGQEINLLTQTRRSPLKERAITYAAAGFAALALILLGISYLNVTLKERAYQFLSKEEFRIYQKAFPNAPPVKDVERVLETKLQSMGTHTTSSGISTSTPLGVLAQISSIIDSKIDVKLNEYNWDDKQFNISGTTVSFAAVEQIKSALVQISGVRNIEIENVDLSAAKQVKFKIRGQF